MVAVFSSMVFNPRPPRRATPGAPTIVVLNIHTLKKGLGCCILMGVALMRRRKSARAQGETAVLAGCNAREAYAVLCHQDRAQSNFGFTEF
jgi:hypothetical protein